MAENDLPEGFELDSSGSNREPASSNSIPSPPPGFELDAPSSAPPEGFELDADPGEPQTSTIGAGLEGIAKGLAGPLATAGELGLSKLGVPGLSAEEQTQREAEHPYAEGAGEAAGLIGGAFVPILGEYTLGSAVARAAGAATKSVEIGKVGQTALKLAIEGGLFHSADNASKMILGQTDPEAPVASFLAGTPTALLFGGLLGGVAGKGASKLQEMANGNTANKFGQFLADMGSRYKVRSEAGDIGRAAADEAQHLYDTTAAAVDDGFKLKRDSVEKLTQNIDPANTSAYVNGLRSTLTKLPRTLMASDAFQDAMQKWQEVVTPTTDIIGGRAYIPSAADIFEATDNFKRRLGELAKFDRPLSTSADQAMGRDAGSLYHNIRTSLENPGMWGDMGDFQKQLNKSYSELQDPLKFFTKTAVKQTAEGAKVDPDVMNNLFKQLGKGKGSLRSDKISQFLDPARKMLDTVDALHAAQGIESSIPKVATPNLNEMLQKEVPNGAKLADWLFDRGPGAMGWAAGHAIGTAIGAISGHAYLGYRAGEHLAPLLKSMGERPTNWSVATALRALSSGDAAGITEAMSYSRGLNKGAQKISRSVDNLFATGGKQYMEDHPSEKDRERLNKHVEDGVLNQQIQNTAKPPITEVEEGPKGFAHGGEVLAPKPAPVPTKPVGGALDGMKHLSSAFPEQSMLLGAAKGRINNYLNSVRPQKINAKLPFDEEMPDKEKKRSYNRALDIANKPLSVLDHIKNGTLSPEHVQHMNGLYPELKNHLQKKITDKITQAQMKKEKPPAHVRQSLSLFMGAALDSNLTPQNIMAAQATFVAQKASAQAAAAQTSKPKKGTASLENEPNQYRTSAQSAQMRQSRVKP